MKKKFRNVLMSATLYLLSMVRVLNGNGKFPYQIFSITGVKVLEGRLENSQKININTLEPGIYTIDTGGQKVKFVKK